MLNNAADSMSTTSSGGRVYVTVRGIEGRHHKGAVRGSVQRPIIIYKKHGAKAITPRLAAAISEAVMKHFHASIAKAAAA